MEAISLKNLLKNITYTAQAEADAERYVHPTANAEQINADSVFFLTKKANGERRYESLELNVRPYAIVCEADDAEVIQGVRTLIVDDARSALSMACVNYCGVDLAAIRFIGITGTNGKTTVAETVFNILRFAGHSVGLFGTGRIRLNDELISDRYYSMTTPDPEVLYPTIAKMQKAGCEYIVMEVSSHALRLGKVAPIFYDVCAFTNLSPEHTDFHPDIEDYYRTKLSLFKKCKMGIFNLDCSFSARAYREANCEKHSVGIIRRADVYATDVQQRGLDGTSFYYREQGLIFGIDLHAPGAFNVYNALIALKCAILLGIKPCIAKRAVNTMEGTPGRMELLRTDIDVIVDYAHTPLAFENALKSIYSAKNTRQRLIVVFGCGGNRDKAKRSEMGRISAKYADLVIITEDNSRLEQRDMILADIAEGITSKERLVIIPDRRDAIFRAITTAVSGDIIAILGKGCENYIIDADGYRDYSDKDTAKEALELRRKQNENKA